MKAVETVSWALARVAGAIAKALLLFVVCIMFLQVVLRFGFNAALPWPEEAARYGMIWVVMLFGGILVRDEQLISVDFFDHFWPRRLLVLRNLAYRLLLFAVLAVLMVEGWEQAITAWPRTTAAMQISWFWPYAAVSVGATLMLLQMMALVVRDVARVLADGKAG